MSVSDAKRELAEAECAKNIERWKVKKMIENLESARGNGTSVISLYMTPKEQIAKTTQMLNVEYGTASNIKSHTNKISVQTAIMSVLGRLKLISRLPANGLIIYGGTVLTEDNKEKKLCMDIEPFKPVSRSLYMCDNKFHTDELHRMLESDEKYGFIIVDGTGTLYGTVSGSQREVLHKFTVELPKKHGRGGQSKNRFARIRMERRHNYVRKVAELATQMYIVNNLPNVNGLVLAGSAEFKDTLFASELFDPRLKAIVMKIVDIAHPFEVGFNQAIDLSADALAGVKLMQEKKLVQRFFDEIATDSSKYCFGIADSQKCLEMGAIETLVVWEDLDVDRYTITKPDGNVEVIWLSPQQVTGRNLAQGENQTTNEVEKMSLVEFLANNYTKFGCTLEIITNRSQEGSQFVRGFGGIGGLLRYKVDLVQLEELEKGRPTGDGDGNFDFEDDFM